MNLREFAEKHDTIRSAGDDFAKIDNGTAHRRISQLLQDATRVEPLLATVFWQIAMSAREYRVLLNEIGSTHRPLASVETIVVPLGSSSPASYTLIVLDRDFASPTPAVIRLKANKLDLRQAWENWRRRRMTELAILEQTSAVSLSTLRHYHGIMGAIGPDFAVKTLAARPVSIIAAALPAIEYTAVPPKPWGVAVGGAAPNSTAGTVVRDSQNRTGVTCSLHGVGGSAKSLCIGTSVTVDGQPGTIRDSDPVCDACFVEVTTLPSTPNTTAGPLKGVSPRQNESVKFDGLVSGTMSATIEGWSPDIPFVQPYNQLKVFTDDKTAQGDSGAALLDGANYILGFAFYRTGINATPAQSAWIWAESVFTSLNLVAF